MKLGSRLACSTLLGSFDTIFKTAFDDDDWLNVCRERADDEHKALFDTERGLCRAGVLGGMGPIACAEGFVDVVNGLRRKIDAMDTGQQDEAREKIVLHLWSDPDMQLFADGIHIYDFDPCALYAVMDAKYSYESFLCCPNLNGGVVALCNTFHLMLYANDPSVVGASDNMVKNVMLQTTHAFSREPWGKSFISLVHKVKEYVEKEHEGEKIVCLSTQNTAQFHMYDTLLHPNVHTDDWITTQSQEGIDLVKAGKIEDARQKFFGALELAQSQGVTVALLACTEIPVALTQKDVDERFDSKMTVISTAAVGVNALVDKILETLPYVH